jgi:acyl carrier protein phosphodiesterase
MKLSTPSGIEWYIWSKMPTIVSMNYLAHAYLGRNRPGEMVGQIMADEIKGKQYLRYSPEIQQGILMHRWVDLTTDESKHLNEVKTIFRPHTGRITGIALDVIMDHFLSIHWSSYHSQPLDSFITEVYQRLNFWRDVWEPTSGERISKLIEQNWLHRYHSIEGLALTMNAMANRKTMLEPLKKCPQLIEKHWVELDYAFHLLIHELNVGYKSKINTFATLTSGSK